MRILCLNANTTEFITRVVGDEMRATLNGTAEVVDATASFGPAVIKTRLDHAVACHGVVDAAAAHAGSVDAVMLAVSFDTGLAVLREALDVPVVGMSEASVAMARMAGGNIGYISLGESVTPLYHETLGHCDVQRDLAGWEALEVPSAYHQGDRDELDALLGAAAVKLATDGADVVVLLGAVLAGAARRAQASSPVPLIDGGRAGALMARAMIELDLRKPSMGSFAARVSGGLCGVSRSLGALQAPE